MPQLVTSVEGIAEFELENGMRVLLFPDQTKDTVTVNNTIFVGSRHEGYGEAGMAHLLEHMVFKGTPTFPNVPKAIRDHGGGRSMNGTTWLDRTNYYETMPASDENLEFAIKLEADRMINSLIRGEDLASEMTVVRNEFERGENSPFRILQQRITSAAFDWHNYGQSTIGNRADIERVPVENLREFYRKYYQPDNAMLVISGSFHPPQALKYVTKYFGSIPKPARKLPTTYTEEPTQDGERSVTLRRVGDVSLVGVAYHVVSGPHPDFAATDILSTSLAQAPSGRLYKALVETKLAASVSGGVFATHDPNLVMYFAEVVAGVEPKEVLQTMIDVLENVGEEPLTEQEVERARARLLNDWEQSFNNSQQAAITLSDWAAQGDWRLFFLYRDRLESAKLADVNRMAAEFLVSSNRTQGSFIPTEKPVRAKIPATPDLASMIGDYKGRAAVAAGEKFDVSPKNIEARTQRSTLDGIQVTALPKKTRGGTLNLRLTLRYGDLDSLQGKAAAAKLVGQMLTRGTNSKTRTEIADELNRYRTQLSASSSQPGVLTFNVQTKRDTLNPVLNLLADIMVNANFPAAEFETLQQKAIASAEQQQSDPQALAQLTTLRLLRDFPADDPRHVPTVQETIDATKALTVDDVRAVYREMVSGKHGQLTVVGDFDLAEVTDILQPALAKLDSSQAYARLATPPSETKQQYIQVPTPDKANAVYFAGCVLPMRDDHPDYPALAIGNDIFGGGGALASRLGDRVRQQDGLSYGVGSMMKVSAHDERTEVMIYAISNPENAPKVKAAIAEELDRIRKDGITQEELDRAVPAYIESRKVGRTKDGTLAALLERYAEAGRTMEFTEQLEANLRTLTVDQVNAAIRKYLDPEKLIVTIAGDLKE